MTCPDRDELEAAYTAACLLPGAYSGKRMWVTRRRASPVDNWFKKD